ncbi:hypothetical protein [Desulfofundulus thermobenzoicus]|nr:hypothetical protein [Desulfofundulus thermobenzoicus]
MLLAGHEEGMYFDQVGAALDALAGRSSEDLVLPHAAGGTVCRWPWAGS